uniref:Kinesin motor domain-containing protein n=1 Tax=Glossina pallidipes TaxID=7398 RepID=A0A1B0AE15_GLOPL
MDRNKCQPHSLLNVGRFENEMRSTSPVMQKPALMQTRVKLRRSRSVSDLRDLKPMKRLETTLAPIPAKVARLIPSSSASNDANAFNPTNRPPRIRTSNSGITTRLTAQTSKAPPTKRAAADPASSTVIGANSRKPTSSATATSVSTTGAGKPINKRLPPYDFKARYNDLLEKHKILTEKYEQKCERKENLEKTAGRNTSAPRKKKNTKIGKECLQRQTNSQQQKIESLADFLTKTTEELPNPKQAYNKLKLEHGELSVEVLELRDRSADLDENFKLMQDITTCKEQLFRSNMERKELHDSAMDLRGNIRVFCRVRPPLDVEHNKLLCGWNYVNESTVEIINCDPLVRAKNNGHIFSFDQVFHPCSKQEDIFELVSPLIQSALDGYNVCIFAYGQTGSGKAFTMDGATGNLGVIPRTVDLLFDSIKAYRNLEIYNEVWYDLLDNEPKEMEIRMTKNNKNAVYVSNITQETVDNADRLRQLMKVARMNRATAATVGNERSSRSRAVTKIELIGSHVEKHENSIGSINLVDLAGSGSPKTSVRMNETQIINRSLSELTNVILALLQKQDHIPYRIY